jgi:hypothetical protein
MRSLHRRPHRAIGSIGVVTLAALAIALVGSPAIALAASTDGSISGVVSDSITTNPVAAICVRAAGGSGSAATHSNAEGEYTLADLSPGTYTVKFSGCRTTLGYVTQYYDDQATSAEANPVTVDAGGNTAGIDASMVLGGGISGSVTDESTPPDPLSDICVAATASGSTAVSTTTNASGDYSYAGLTPGSYEVKFTDCHHHVYVPTSYASAVTVTAGVTTTGIDVAMSLPGSISGTVTDADTSNPLAGICVSAEDWNTGKVLSTDISGSDGTYSLPGLVGGTYAVQFSGCGATSDYVGQFWDDEASFYYSDPVTVSDGTDTDAIDASMVQGGSISGTVTDYSTPPVPLSDICVAADVIEQGGGT